MFRSRITGLISAFVIAIFVALPIFASPTSAEAYDNIFGLRYWNANLTYGNIVSITVPTAADQQVTSTDFILSRTVEQSGLTGNPGLIQAGLYTSGGTTHIDQCGTTSSTTVQFTEWKPVNGTYTCATGDRVYAGNNENYNVFVNSGGWNAKINDAAFGPGPFRLNGFPDGYGMIGGEIYSSSSSNKSTSYVGFGDGGSGTSGWGYYNGPNEGLEAVATPNSSTATILTGGWSIGQAPTPLFDNH